MSLVTTPYRCRRASPTAVRGRKLPLRNVSTPLTDEFDRLRVDAVRLRSAYNRDGGRGGKQRRLSTTSSENALRGRAI
ncbi:hypothetical protein ACFPA8_11395 [Streptomyces ovatisporus]|uniref:Uncharacterized protein n=1 Tax=Streptomyces ovatisporus TaxID=1128682 RepID=A0ABV9A736_9ACTN